MDASNLYCKITLVWLDSSMNVYNTCRATNLNYLNHTIPTNKLYRKSFFISAIKESNGLEHCLTNVPSPAIFKNKLMKRNQIEHLYLNNNIPRYSQTIIAQLRIGFSPLNTHLFNKGLPKVRCAMWQCM